MNASGRLLARRVLDLLLFLSLCFMAGTGLLMAYRLVPGSGPLQVLGLTRHQWGDVHAWVGYLFLLTAAMHLALQWKWIIKCAANGRTWVALGILAAGAALIAAFLLLPIRSAPERQHRGVHSGHAAQTAHPWRGGR